jgi:hypothetical protein
MRLAVYIVWASAVFAGVAPSAFGQIAADTLVQTGILTQQTGRYSPLTEGAVRLYAQGQSFSGTRTYNMQPNTESDNNTGATVAGDFNFRNVVISAGYQDLSERDTSLRGVTGATRDTTRSQSLLSISSATDRINGEARVSLVTLNVRETFPNASGTANPAYTDAIVGMSADMTQHLRFGFNFSPVVGVSGPFNGTLGASGARASRQGHGTQVRVSLGYNSSSFNVSADSHHETENNDARAPSKDGFNVRGAWLIGIVQLLATYDRFHQSELTDTQGATPVFVSPAQDTSTAIVGASLVLGSWVISVSATHSQSSTQAFSDPSGNPGRFESEQSQSLLLSILKVL